MSIDCMNVKKEEHFKLKQISFMLYVEHMK